MVIVFTVPKKLGLTRGKDQFSRENVAGVGAEKSKPRKCILRG